MSEGPLNARVRELERAITNASYALNPNQGGRPDPTIAGMWLRTTFPKDHPNYVSPDHPLLAGTDFAGRRRCRCGFAPAEKCACYQPPPPPPA